MKNRWFVGFGIYIIFSILFQTPFGWLTINFLFAICAIYEYADVHRGILLKVYESDRSCIDQIYDETEKVL